MADDIIQSGHHPLSEGGEFVGGRLLAVVEMDEVAHWGDGFLQRGQDRKNGKWGIGKNGRGALHNNPYTLQRLCSESPLLAGCSGFLWAFMWWLCRTEKLILNLKEEHRDVLAVLSYWNFYS